MALRRFHFLNPMIHSQTHSLKGWPGHRLVKIGLATRPSIAKWQFQNLFLFFLGVWVKLVAQWWLKQFQQTLALSCSVLSVSSRRPAKLCPQTWSEPGSKCDLYVCYMKEGISWPRFFPNDPRDGRSKIDSLSPTFKSSSVVQSCSARTRFGPKGAHGRKCHLSHLHCMQCHSRHAQIWSWSQNEIQNFNMRRRVS